MRVLYYVMVAQHEYLSYTEQDILTSNKKLKQRKT